MFKVKYFDKEYVVYGVKCHKVTDSTYFLIYKDGRWEWVDSYLYEPLEEE